MASAAALALPLAKVGEVGEGFFHERTSDDAALPGAAKASSSASAGRRKTSAASARRPCSTSNWSCSRSSLGFAIAFALALLAHRRRWLRRRCWAPPASSTRPQHRLLLPAAADHRPRPRHGDHRPQRLHPADHLPQHDRRPRQRARQRSRTPPAAWA